jgi:hypothetical protein
VTRTHYTPRLSWKPLRFVRWRSCPYAGEVRKRWRLYLFGVMPIGSIPRGPACRACQTHPDGECPDCWWARAW